jgi:hypothetical protein
MVNPPTSSSCAHPAATTAASPLVPTNRIADRTPERMKKVTTKPLEAEDSV